LGTIRNKIKRNPLKAKARAGMEQELAKLRKESSSSFEMDVRKEQLTEDYFMTLV
jgi:hypothetical protein